MRIHDVDAQNIVFVGPKFKPWQPKHLVLRYKLFVFVRQTRWFYVQKTAGELEGTGLDRGGLTKKPVAGIAESGNYEGLFVKAGVESGGDDVNAGAHRLNTSHTFGG